MQSSIYTFILYVEIKISVFIQTKQYTKLLLADNIYNYSMDFPSYDIFQDESQAEEEDVERLAVKQREAYRVKSCSPQLDPAAQGWYL